MNNLDYIAKCQHCGRCVAWSSGEMPTKELSKEVASWVRDGLQIERVTTEVARALEWRHSDDCPTNKPKRKKAAALFD